MAVDILLVFALAIFAAFLPYLVNSTKRVITWINCVGAGILLGTCFFHLMPEVKETFDEQCYKPKELAFEIFVLGGFLFILLVEQFTLTYLSSWCGGHSHGPAPPLINSAHETHCHTRTSDYHPDHLAHSQVSLTPEQQVLVANDHTHVVAVKHHPAGDAHGHSHSHGTDAGDVFELTTPHAGDDHDHCHEDVQQHSGIRSLAFVASLSIHSVIEGFALILQARDWRTNLPILISIATHKLAIGLTMGFNIKESRLTRRMSKMALFLWASFTPIGSILGLGLCENDILESSWLPPANAIGLGTFLYILFFEIAPHEFLGAAKRDNRFLKAIVLCFGVLTMLVLARVSTHSHSHGHHDCPVEATMLSSEESLHDHDHDGHADHGHEQHDYTSNYHEEHDHHGHDHHDHD